MKKQQECRLLLTARFTEAVEYARRLHTEFRKGTCIPYMAHLLGVASLVMGEAGGKVPVNEDMVIAAILHDVVEDHGGETRLREVEKEFGANVARIVESLSDTLAEDHNKKEGWRSARSSTSSGYAMNRKTCSSSPALTSCTTPKRSWTTSRKLARRFLRGSSAVRTSSFGISIRLLATFRLRLRSRLVEELASVVHELARLTGE